MTASPPLWKASVALHKNEASDLAALLELASAPQAVLIAEDPFGSSATVEALYVEEPDGTLLSRLSGRRIAIEPLADRDWIKLSQEGLAPVRAGRFFVHGAHDRGEIPHGMISLCIEAGLAFGTGHHESTALCLSLLSDLAHRPIRKVLDLGAGTGLLAIAAAKLWKRPVLASDIDPAAVEVTRENARANGAGALVRAVAADGLSHPVLAGAAPYGLILANILAGPLARLAPQLVAAVAPGGTLILSGLLATQEATVIAFYHRLRLAARRRQGPWSALVLVKARR